MGRAPCCDKVGLKKGPWTKEEDHLLINYIHEHGHGNWRALPKKAGLLRCGKSCRLRWTNYLRPDIKRGNFSKEEEDTVIQLHQALGNRWSAIAATLPGRTDNEIKNVWHTHLKKRLLKQQKQQQQQQPMNQTTQVPQQNPKFDHQNSNSSPMNISIKQEHDMNNQSDDLLQYSSFSTTDDNSSSSLDPTEMFLVSNDSVSNNNREFMDQDIWNDVVSSQDHSLPPVLDLGFGYNQTTHDDIDFWCDHFTRTEDISDLLEF